VRIAHACSLYRSYILQYKQNTQRVVGCTKLPSVQFVYACVSSLALDPGVLPVCTSLEILTFDACRAGSAAVIAVPTYDVGEGDVFPLRRRLSVVASRRMQRRRASPLQVAAAGLTGHRKGMVVSVKLPLPLLLFSTRAAVEIYPKLDRD
jgi:hypothetical protein